MLLLVAFRFIKFFVAELFSQLGIDWRLLLAQAVNFLLVLYILNRFVFKKLLTLMQERRDRIEKGLEMREEAERELERAHQARKTELLNARKEASDILAEAKALGTERERELVQQAKREAERVMQKAQEDMRRETEVALQDAKADMIRLAMTAAEKVLERSITEKDKERLMEEVAQSLSSNYAGK